MVNCRAERLLFFFFSDTRPRWSGSQEDSSFCNTYQAVAALFWVPPLFFFNSVSVRSSLFLLLAQSFTLTLISFFLSFTLSLFLSRSNHYHPHFLPSYCTLFLFQYQCISLTNIHIFCPSFSHLLSTLLSSLSLPLHEVFIFLRYSPPLSLSQ
ncbi:unnamed protein product [Acanthosepion pharaonis]|uniref:Uncharacterized protein n=1 Tax=Acanthosepion pharaonis TaxID=158019 RepID=A0A812BM07_ACAPH|nr:unnamed protein product [Sepia pharaonis]